MVVACCGGGCGGCCSYGCYRPQQQQQQQRVIYVPVPMPVNPKPKMKSNNIGGGGGGGDAGSGGKNGADPDGLALGPGIIGAAARTYRNYYSGSSGGTSGYNTNSNLYSNSNLNALNVLRQQQQAQQLARASSSSSSLDTSASSSQAQTNALLASLLAQMQQQMATTTTTTTRQTTTTTTPTTTTTTTTKPAFDFQAAFAALLAQMPLLRPAPTIPETTTSTTTTTTTTPKPVVLSQEQVDQLRNILAALGGGGLGGALAPARAHVGPKGLADLVAQDAAGGDTTTAAEDVIPEVTEHPPEFASVHPMPSRLLTLLHMADSVDQMNQAQYSRARPLSSRLASMLDPNNTESSQNNNNQTVPGADVPPPPPLLLPPLTKVNVPTPPAEKDPNIIRGNVFAWENGALSLDDLGKWEKEFDLVDLGGFEKLNPAPDDGDEGLDDEQLQGVFNDFYYKLDTYDARGSVENADLGDEAYEQKMEEEEKAKRRKK